MSEIIDHRAIAERLEREGVARAETLAQLARPAVRIVPARVDIEYLPLGASRFGGGPDVPAGFSWPTKSERPLAFLAQIDLSEARAPGLPQAGWLLFFYDAEEEPWGFDPADEGGAVVRFIEAGAALKRMTPPPGDGFHPCRLSFEKGIHLPDLWDSLLEMPEPLVPNEEWDAYGTVETSLSLEEDGIELHHLVGHPQLIQNDMRGECQLASNGVYCGNAGSYDGERAQALLREAPWTWTLLLQIDTDEEGPGWMWGDGGRLYFWIRQSDLERQDFSRPWLVLQCY